MKTKSLQILYIVTLLGQMPSLAATPEPADQKTKQPPIFFARSSFSQTKGIFTSTTENVAIICSWGSQKPNNPHEWLVQCRTEVDGKTKETTEYTVTVDNEFRPTITDKNGAPIRNTNDPLEVTAISIAGQKAFDDVAYKQNSMPSYWRTGELALATASLIVFFGLRL